jgi:predicted O-methyltransferase YrrM
MAKFTLRLDRTINPKINGYGEHYALLSSLSLQMPDDSVLADVGTYQGYSAVALARNPKVRVVTYDEIDFVTLALPKNVTRVLHVELERIAEIASADLVLLDVSPHDGDKEQKFFDELRRRSFEGILILDDIYWKLDKGMTSFWESITLKKIDVTAIGHYTGTGIVVFNPDKWDVEG